MSRAFLLIYADHQIERLPDRLRCSIGHERPAAGICLDQTLLAQSFYRLAHCRAAHTETLREFALGWQLITRLELAFQDRIFDLLDNLLKEARGFDCAVHGFNG